jgi:hypothetical protein
MVFNTTFNNISVILWQSVLLVEGTDESWVNPNTEESWVKPNTDESWVKPNTDELWVNPNINDVMPSKCSVDNILLFTWKLPGVSIVT